MEEAEERHQVEIKVYKQKAKQLLYEHHNASAELRMNSKFQKLNLKNSKKIIFKAIWR